jgi:hypothetical protein
MSRLGTMLSAEPSLIGQISQTESRIAMRRTHLSEAMVSMGESFSRRAVSPETLGTAVLFGAALERSRYIWDWRLLALLGAGRVGIRLLHRLVSRTAA